MSEFRERSPFKTRFMIEGKDFVPMRSTDSEVPPLKKFASNFRGFPYPCDESVPREIHGMSTWTRCHLCEVDLLSKAHATSHYAGKNHAKKIRLWSLKSKVDDESSTYCKYCDIQFSSAIVARDHYLGKKHQSAINKRGHKNAAVKPNTGNTEISLTGSEDKTGQWGIGANFVPLPSVTSHLPPPVASLNAKDQLNFVCDICNVACNTAAVLETHYNGAKHKKKLALKQNLPEGPSTGLAKNRTPSGQYYCEHCNLSVNSDQQYIQHLGSKKHKMKISNSSKESSNTTVTDIMLIISQEQNKEDKNSALESSTIKNNF